MLTVDAWRKLVDPTRSWKERYPAIEAEIRATLLKQLEEGVVWDTKTLVGRMVPADSGKDTHRRVYQAITAMTQRGGRLADTHTVVTRRMWGSDAKVLRWHRPIEQRTTSLIELTAAIRDFLADESKFGSTISEELSSMLGDILSHV